MKLIELDTVNSTNTWSLEHFEDLEDFCVVSANIQTQGKGRFDRVWVSDNCKNIYMSFVLKPEKKDYIANLTQYLSVVVSKIIEKYGVKPEIKWPNDVLVNGKKICGILCETKLFNNKIKGVVLGIGINLNMKKTELAEIDKPATALNIETDKEINKNEFLNLLLSEFEKGYKQVTEEGFLSISAEYKKRTNFLGKKFLIQQKDGAQKQEILVKKLNEDGSLTVETTDGNEKIIFSGDLFT